MNLLNSNFSPFGGTTDAMKNRAAHGERYTAHHFFDGNGRRAQST
jgi:hypothetical protein